MAAKTFTSIILLTTYISPFASLAGAESFVHGAVSDTQQPLVHSGQAGSPIFSSNSTNDSNLSAQDELINVPLLRQKYPELLSSSHEGTIVDMSLGLEKTPLSAVRFVLNLACDCKGTDCRCPEPVRKLNEFIEFQTQRNTASADAAHESEEMATEEGTAAEEEMVVGGQASQKWQPNRGYWDQQFGEVPQTITHADLAAAEKTLRYLRVHPCDCFGPPPCCPPVMATCSALKLRKVESSCDMSCRCQQGFGSSHKMCCPC